MVKNDIRPYEISLWTLQDGFISVLKPIGVYNRGQIETPKCQIKNDGTQELNFSIPMYYRDNGVLVENPIWYNVINGSLIVNLRKLKLIFNKGEEGKEEVFEFVISKVIETHTDGQLHCEVTAEGLAFQELGKVGYKISLNPQDYEEDYNKWFDSTVGEDTEDKKFDYATEEEKAAAEPLNNINYWADKIFKGSNWDYEIQMDWSSFDGIITDKDREVDNEEREEQGLRRTDKIYEEEYISSWHYDEENEILSPRSMENFKEKCRQIELEKSNRYNLSQELAEIFGVFCKYKYIHDNNYHIIGRKCIFYNNFLSEQEGKIDIIYPYSTSKIEREIDSADVVTKMFVTALEDDTMPSGLVSIADAAPNKSQEDYILNFDYLYSIGTITEEQYRYIEDYERTMFNINSEIKPIAEEIIKLQNDLVEYEAQRATAYQGKLAAQEQIDNAKTFCDKISDSGGYSYKNLDTPYPGTLILEEKISEDNKKYYININQEGVIVNDDKGEYKYPLKEYLGDSSTNIEFLQGLKIYYPVKSEDNTFDKVYESLTESNFQYDENGNLEKIVGFIKPSDMDPDKGKVKVLFAHSPKIYYENIRDIYQNRLEKDTILEQEAIDKIEGKKDESGIVLEKGIKTKLEELENQYKILLEKKEKEISDFENMMGPAIKEGSWQAENYTDYASKYEEQILMKGENSVTNKVEFIWDTKPFDEEQLISYPVGIEEEIEYYYYIDISEHLETLKNHLDFFSLYYDEIKKEENQEPVIVTENKSMTIGSELQFAFIKEDEDSPVKPILLLLDKNFNLDNANNFNIYGLVKEQNSETKEIEGIKKSLLITSPTIQKPEDIVFIQVFPRLKIKDLTLKISDEDILIKSLDFNFNPEIKEKSLRKFYDYYILSRDDAYYITIKNNIILENGNMEKAFNISYSLSNAALALYLDALEVSKTNAFPKVSYNLEVSAMNKNFIEVAYKSLNRIVSINDSDLKFEDVQGYISELDLDLDNPWEDSITVQNYKTKFEDLFSTIVASTEQMKVNSFAYNNAASAFGAGGLLRPSVIQNTLNKVDLTYAFQNGTLTIDELNGIWARSDDGVVAIRGGGIFCATETDTNGNWLWNTGITPKGISASLITAGQLDTNLIKVYAGDELRFQLNADGLFAYRSDEIGEALLNEYVVHNSEGLFLVAPKKQSIATLAEEDTDSNEGLELIKKVEISWNGLILRNDDGEKVFYADPETGNLIIAGEINAATGKIAGWTIEKNSLLSGDIQDNGLHFAGIQSIHKLDENENSPYPIFWVGENFKVESDGTLKAKNGIFEGTVSADTFIGNSKVEDIINAVKKIEVVNISGGDTFNYYNDNLDGNYNILPGFLRFRIMTNGLTNDELAVGVTDWVLQYQALDENNSLIWVPIEDFITNSNYNFESNSLTFILKSDIMKMGKEKISYNDSLRLKVSKQGKRIPLDEWNQPVINEMEDCVYESEFTIYNKDYGASKYLSLFDPQSYSFIEDANIPKVESATFSLTMTDVDIFEGSWSLGNEEIVVPNSLRSTDNTEIDAPEDKYESAIFVPEINLLEGEWFIDDVKVADGDKIIGDGDFSKWVNIDYKNYDETTHSGTVKITIINDDTKFPEGSQLTIRFQIGKAVRTAQLFKLKNGSDSYVITIRSSSGDSFINGEGETTLSTEVYAGGTLLDSSNLYYLWSRDEQPLETLKTFIEKKNEDGEIIIEEKEISYGEVENKEFFTRREIIITPKDIIKKANYTCHVYTDLESVVKDYKTRTGVE